MQKKKPSKFKPVIYKKNGSLFQKWERIAEDSDDEPEFEL